MAMRPVRVPQMLLILAIAVFLSGCAHKPKVKEEPPAGTFLEDVYTTNNTRTDLEAFSDAMPPYLQYLDGLINGMSDEKLLCRAAGAYYGDAYCLVEDRDRKEASRLYLRGREIVLSELKRYRIFDQAVTYKSSSIEAFRQSLPDSFGKANVPVIYWTAMNWAGWILINRDKPDAVADIPKAQAMLEFVSSFDDSYKNGSAHAVLGCLYAAIPKTRGGDPARAQKEFDKAFACSFNSVLTYHVMYAKYYAYQIKDRDLFKTTLESVLEKPADFNSDMNFLNEVAKKKADHLLKNIDKYFKKTPMKAGDVAGKQPEAAAGPQDAASQAQGAGTVAPGIVAQPQSGVNQPEESAQTRDAVSQPQDPAAGSQEAASQSRETGVQPPGVAKQPETSTQPQEPAKQPEASAQTRDAVPQPQDPAAGSQEAASQSQDAGVQAPGEVKQPETSAQPQETGEQPLERWK